MTEEDSIAMAALLHALPERLRAVFDAQAALGDCLRALVRLTVAIGRDVADLDQRLTKKELDDAPIRGSTGAGAAAGRYRTGGMPDGPTRTVDRSPDPAWGGWYHAPAPAGPAYEAWGVEGGEAMSEAEKPPEERAGRCPHCDVTWSWTGKTWLWKEPSGALHSRAGSVKVDKDGQPRPLTRCPNPDCLEPLDEPV